MVHVSLQSLVGLATEPMRNRIEKFLIKQEIKTLQKGINHLTEVRVESHREEAKLSRKMVNLKARLTDLGE